jgi:hypothetical protein
MRLQPREQVEILCLRERPGQCLIEMMMCIHKARQNHLTRQIQHHIRIRRKIVAGPHLFDEPIPNKQPTIADLATLVIHRHEDFSGPCQHRGHNTLLDMGSVENITQQ